MLSSGFSLKKKPLGTMPETPQQLENRRKAVFPAECSDGLDSVAFSPNGQTLAAEGLGGKILLWNVAGGHFGMPRTRGFAFRCCSLP